MLLLARLIDLYSVVLAAVILSWVQLDRRNPLVVGSFENSARARCIVLACEGFANLLRDNTMNARNRAEERFFTPFRCSPMFTGLLCPSGGIGVPDR